MKKQKTKLIKFTSLITFIFSMGIASIPIWKSNIINSNNEKTIKIFEKSEKINKTKISAPSTLDDLRSLPIDDIISLKKLDMRDYNIVTPVKNQGSEGICWAYAMAAASEVSMLYKKGVVGENYNGNNFGLSSKNIDRIVNIRNGNYDKLKLTDQDIINRSLGNATVSMFYSAQMLMQQNAPIIGTPNANADPGNNAAWLESIVSIPNNEIEIKKAVAKYGAVSFAYQHSGYTAYYATKTNPTHAVTIVGWDDDFLKERFGPTKPTRNGAWIVKNSWGIEKYDEGYFYLAYDSYIQDIIAFDYVNKDKYQNLYYYDGLGRLNQSQEIGNKKTAVIFPTKIASYDKIEKLKGITFGLYGKNAKVKATIYTDIDLNPTNRYSKINNPEKGNKVHEQTSEIYPNKFHFGGTYTMTLDKEIELKPGTNFSIVLEAINDDNTAQILFSSEPQSTNDLTFYQNENQWLNCASADLGSAQYNVASIKALTTTKDKTGNKDNNLLYSNVTFNQKEFNYENDLKPIPIVKYENKVLKEKQDYIFEQEQIFETNNDNQNQVGTLITTIKGLNDYKGIKKIYSIINKGEKPKLDLNGLGSFDDKNEIAYINIKNSFEYKINKYSDINLPEGWQFENDGILKNGLNEGNKIEYIKNDANYYKKTKFAIKVNKETITNNINNSTYEINGSPFYYIGNEIKPEIELKFNNQLLTLGIDYNISYKNNIEVGQANIIINGINYFNEEKIINFEIIKAKNEITSFSIDDNGNPIATSLFGQENIIYIYYKKDEENLIELPEKPKISGKYYVKAYVSETKNYESASSKILDYEILENPISKRGISNTTIIIISTTIPLLVIIIIFVIIFIIKRKFKK